MTALLLRYWPHIAAALALAALVWWIADMRSTVASQRTAITALQRDVAAEKLARERDVAALTSLSTGLAKAATDTAADRKALAETIDASDARPVSPALAAFLDRLRAADADRAGAAPGAGR